MSAAALLLTACDTPESSPAPISIDAVLGGEAHPDFARADKPREFSFPADHGAHPDFRNEWWYFTGNLFAEDGRHFGFQFTLFRTALTPEPAPQQSAWASNTVWMAHAALTDVEGEKHYAKQRFSRGAPMLAGVQTNPLRLWINDWELTASGNDFPWQLQLATDQFQLALKFEALKAVVLQGENGLSRKNDDPGNASYYYSLTRLDTSGEITINNTAFEVNGSSWLDREWSTSALAREQTGWDWFALQFDDNRDMMFYRLRDAAGNSDRFSSGVLVDADGSTRTLTAQDIELAPREWWQAPNGERYPVRWSLRFRQSDRKYSVVAVLPDQYMDLAVAYWEGAVVVIDESGQRAGIGYLEMARSADTP